MLGDNFNLSTSGNRQSMDRSEYLKYGGLGLLFILLIVLYVFEFKYFNLALGVKPMVIAALLIGLLMGISLGHRYRYSGKDLTDRIQIYVFFGLICMIFMPLFASLSNRLLSFSAPTQVEVEFVEQEAFYSSRLGVIKGEEIKPTGYYNFFYHNEKLHRIKTEQPLFNEELERGTIVSIPVKKGLWGVDIVKVK